MAKSFWLMKSDPDTYTIEDLERDGVTEWSGVRNYKARNFMRRQMEVGDPVLFYHSNADPTGVYGLAEVASEPHADSTQFDMKSGYYDPDSDTDDPRWWCVDIRHVETFPAPVSREAMKETPGLAWMQVLKRGMRLSVMPVTAKEFEIVVKLGRRGG